MNLYSILAVNMLFRMSDLHLHDATLLANMINDTQIALEAHRKVLSDNKTLDNNKDL
jgi:hypothetical protein